MTKSTYVYVYLQTLFVNANVSSVTIIYFFLLVTCQLLAQILKG